MIIEISYRARCKECKYIRPCRTKESRARHICINFSSVRKYMKLGSLVCGGMPVRLRDEACDNFKPEWYD